MSLYLIIMGVQGAGKGTQAAFIAQEYSIPHVSTGDMFRAMKSRDDDLAKRVQEIMNSGALVPDEVTNEVLQDRLEQEDATNGVILDGYPRNIAQAQWLQNYLESKGESLTAVLLLDLDPYTAFKRAYGRVKSRQTGQTYNIFFHDNVEYKLVEHPEQAYPPRLAAKDKNTGEELERRSDDEPLSVLKRIDTYLETTRPLISYYEERDLLVRIDADQPIDAVSQQIKDIITKASVGS